MGKRADKEVKWEDSNTIVQQQSNYKLGNEAERSSYTLLMVLI